MDTITYKGYRIVISCTDGIYEAIGYKNEEREYSHSKESEEEVIQKIKNRIDKYELSEVLHN